MGQEKVEGILFFHAFTCCDTVSAFHNKGKKTAWQIWDTYPEASPVFSKLSQYLLKGEDGDLEILEKFVILMYNRSSTAATMDEVSLDMLARKQRPYEAIPQLEQLYSNTPDVLLTRLTGCALGQATQCQPEAESSAYWGWQWFDDEWQVFWTSNSLIAQSCQQLTKCGCKSDCGRCKCHRLGLSCTTLCRCEVKQFSPCLSEGE